MGSWCAVTDMAVLQMLVVVTRLWFAGFGTWGIICMQDFQTSLRNVWVKLT